MGCGPERSVTFGGTEPQNANVSTTWTLGGAGKSYTEWEAIQIFSPTSAQSNHADFALTCL
jgi:hypothetical protein